MKAAESAKPSSVLDIGPGFGKYGVLLRERLDVRYNRYDRKDWKVQIDAVEIYTPYITKLHKYIYSNIYTGNIINVIGKLQNYDLIMFIDGLEHLDKEDGIELCKKMYEKTDRLLLLSFPRSWRLSSNAEWENKSELHRSFWSYLDLSKIFGAVETCSPTVFAIRKNAEITNSSNLRAG